jgi:hypothetical protein
MKSSPKTGSPPGILDEWHSQWRAPIGGPDFSAIPALRRLAAIGSAKGSAYRDTARETTAVGDDRDGSYLATSDGNRKGPVSGALSAARAAGNVTHDQVDAIIILSAANAASMSIPPSVEAQGQFSKLPTRQITAPT